jgi:branched-chain amino acid aminotransferase
MVSTFLLEEGTATLVGRAVSLAEATSRLSAGAYTTLRTYGGDGLVRLRDHVRRLEESAAAQGHAVRLREDQVRRALAVVLHATRHAESRLRLTLAPPGLFACIEPFEGPSPELYERGAWCVTVPVRRAVPQAKDTRFIAIARRTYESLPPGAHEGLIVGEDEAILEGLTSNFFSLCGGQLHTESGRALAGVTRTVVLELALGVPLAGRAVRVDELPQANECFLTSASREVMPVARVDGQTIGDGRPGEFTQSLLARFRAQMMVEADHLLR